MTWLEAYLFDVHIELTGEQNRIKKYICKDTNGMGTMLGWIAGFYQSSAGIHPLYHFPDDFEENVGIANLKGALYEHPYREFLDFQDAEDEKPDKLSFVLEANGWFSTLKRDLEEFRTYWPGFTPLEPIH